jgi:hypothetical protein
MSFTSSKNLRATANASLKTGRDYGTGGISMTSGQKKMTDSFTSDVLNVSEPPKPKPKPPKTKKYLNKKRSNREW